MNNDKIKLQKFVAVFMDLLGHKTKTLELDELPQNDEQRRAAFETLRDTLGIVEEIRSDFRKSIEKYRDFVVSGRAFHLMAFEHGFSDSFVLAVPLENPDRQDETLFAINMIIGAAGAMMIDALSQDRPIRGGIDLGVGVKLDNGELYGSALVKPYLLESRVADYPRILVGAALLKFLNDYNQLIPRNVDQKLAKDQAKDALRKIGTDSDGLAIVDYFGEAFLPKEKEWIIKARNFSESARAKFEAKGDSKLVKRYDRLIAYIKSRFPLWESHDS